MRKRIRAAAFLCAAAFVLAFAGCAGTQGTGRDVVYEDMAAAFETAGLRSANIGIFIRTERDGAVSYGGCGSGVIFEKEDGAYYALTAAHVVSAPDGKILVFTVNTEKKAESIPGLDGFDALAPETYEAMYEAQVAFVSSRDDLAVIRFAADETLAAVGFADADPAKGDRIMCIGNPQNEWFAASYGKITSGIETLGETQGYPSNAMKHTAYIQVGSSGGAAFNERMQLAGITPGAALSLNGKSFKYGFMIPISEIRLCLEAWDRK